MPSACARSPHTSNAYFRTDSLIELMHAGRQPAARDRRRRAPWIGHRGGEGAALLPAVGHSSPRPAEAETGAQLLQRVGRGIRLTQAGQLLAERAAESIGRLDLPAR